jgi:branched-chain amino acid transport system permease protein
LAIRDAEVAGEAVGVDKQRAFLWVFAFSGFLAGVAGALFSTLQSYITPDAFSLDLSILFFMMILIGGRGSVAGPLLATLILTLLPELSAPLVTWAPFLYAALLLAIVLLVPGGIAAMINAESRNPMPSDRAIEPRPSLLPAFLDFSTDTQTISLRDVRLRFGEVRALDGLSLDIRAGAVHGLIGPNGSGKTTSLNVISGFVAPQHGTVVAAGRDIMRQPATARASLGIARTFQTPKVVGEASVLTNVMIGGVTKAKAGFALSLLRLPKHLADERTLRDKAMMALEIVGLRGLENIQADRLQHSELRFLEIARALMLSPQLLLLDEPAAGLSSAEIEQLAELIRALGAAGIGVLLVEHHSDLVFDVCENVTVLNLGKVLAQGSPSVVRNNKEVVDAYLGA